MAIGKVARGKRAQLHTKSQETFWQGTGMRVHVYMQTCKMLKYLLGQKWNILALREEDLCILCGHSKINYS